MFLKALQSAAVALAVLAAPGAAQSQSASAIPGVTHEKVKLNGFNMHYLQGVPAGGKFRGTIFLVHGFPSLSYGWRNQFQDLMNLGLRVIAMDSIGYGQTDAPQPLADYTFKRAADNVNALAKKLGAKRIILGGHDWGGATVYRIYHHYPQLVSHIFSIAVPYIPPTDSYVPLKQMAKASPSLGYQVQMASGDVEKNIKTKDDIKGFINSFYGGTTPEGLPGFSLNTGLNFNLTHKVRKSPLLSAQDLELYATEYARHGMKGPCNWYRTSELNWKNDKAIKNQTIAVPTMYIDTTKTALIPAEIMRASKALIPHLTLRDVSTSHWAMLENPKAVNQYIKEWIEKVVFGGKQKI